MNRSKSMFRPSRQGPNLSEPLRKNPIDWKVQKSNISTPKIDISSKWIQYSNLVIFFFLNYNILFDFMLTLWPKIQYFSYVSRHVASRNSLDDFTDEIKITLQFHYKPSIFLFALYLLRTYQSLFPSVPFPHLSYLFTPNFYRKSINVQPAQTVGETNSKKFQ